MISKAKLKEHIDQFPKDEISIDELIDRLVFIEKLEKRIALSEGGGSTVSEEEMRNDIKKGSKLGRRNKLTGIDLYGELTY